MAFEHNPTLMNDERRFLFFFSLLEPASITTTCSTSADPERDTASHPFPLPDRRRCRGCDRDSVVTKALRPPSRRCVMRSARVLLAETWKRKRSSLAHLSYSSSNRIVFMHRFSIDWPCKVTSLKFIDESAVRSRIHKMGWKKGGSFFIRSYIRLYS